MRWTLGATLALAFVACGGTPPSPARPVASREVSSAATVSPARSGPAAPLPPSPPPALSLTGDVFRDALWTRDGSLVLVTRTQVFLVAASGPPRELPAPAGAPSPIDRVFGRQAARFVVLRENGAASLYGADGRDRVPLVHDAGVSATQAEVSPDGTRIAVLGCAPPPAKGSSVPAIPRCGVLFGAAGERVGILRAPHDLAQLAFSPSGKYLFARGDSRGITFFDLDGKTLATRPTWRRNTEVHGYFDTDFVAFDGDLAIVAQPSQVELLDLAQGGKRLHALQDRNLTLAVGSPRTHRVAALFGSHNRLAIWDADTGKVVRSFSLSPLVRGTCEHCIPEMDEVDPDVVWVSPVYGGDPVRARISSGALESAPDHISPFRSLGSAESRVVETYDREKSRAFCWIHSRVEARAPAPIPMAYCNRADARDAESFGLWPFPGFSPDGKRLAALHEGKVYLFDLTEKKTVRAFGKGASLAP